MQFVTVKDRKPSQNQSISVTICTNGDANPNGKIGKNWSAAKSEGKEKYRVRFKSSDCLNCDQRLNCTKSKRWRVVSFAGREEQEFLEKTRSAEQSSEWQNLYQERAGIEGTISQSVRGYGLRQTR